MLNSPVTIINAKNLGTTRFLTGSTPNTCKASSSSRILRAPRSAVIAVPATPASTIAVTNGANSRIDASTKKPPSRSSAPKSTRKFAACRPGAAYPNATVETTSGNQQSFRAKRNWLTNSPPYGYGGRMADTMVFPVRIIMSPTSSSRPLAGRKALSATPRTTLLPSALRRLSARPGRQTTEAVLYPQTGTDAETCAVPPDLAPRRVGAGMVAAGMRDTGRRLAVLAAAGLALVLAGTGCGEERQGAR